MKPITTIGILVTLSITQSVCASVIEYGLNDRDEWFADVGGPNHVSTVDFAGYSDFTPITDQWADLGINFSGFVVTIGEDFIGLPTDGWGVRGEPDINVTFDDSIYWIAADLPGYTTVELYSDDHLIYSSSIWGSGGPGHFGGLISDVPFNRVRFGEDGVPIEFLDNIHFGPPIAVPSPASFIAIALPLFIQHRRRRCEIPGQLPIYEDYRTTWCNHEIASLDGQCPMDKKWFLESLFLIAFRAAHEKAAMADTRRITA